MRHRTALLPVPTEAELAECVKRKASITKKAGVFRQNKQWKGKKLMFLIIFTSSAAQGGGGSFRIGNL